MHESLLDDAIARAEIFAPTDAVPGRALHIGRPIRAEVDWQCSHQITGYAGEDAVTTAYGADSFQALYLCMKLVRVRMLELERQLGTRLVGWDSGTIGPP
ncbi:MAG: hypothetical protein ABI194_02505 [Gemmatimonadaceae bacterium]